MRRPGPCPLNIKFLLDGAVITEEREIKKIDSQILRGSPGLVQIVREESRGHKRDEHHGRKSKRAERRPQGRSQFNP